VQGALFIVFLILHFFKKKTRSIIRIFVDSSIIRPGLKKTPDLQAILVICSKQKVDSNKLRYLSF
jgi:hypothetical protein